MLHLGSLKTGWQSSWKILRKIYATYCGGQIGGLNRTSKLRRHDDAVKKKGEAFGGSQKKRLQGSTSTTPLLLFCLGNSFDRTSNGFGWIFFFGGGTPSIASLGWYFNLCDLMLRQKNEYLGWTNDNSNYDKLWVFLHQQIHVNGEFIFYAQYRY
jgi:hypothetical protein